MKRASSEQLYERLQGKTAWITGASSGIGWSTSLLLARYGCNVYASGRNEGALRELERRNRLIRAVPFDIADAEARNRAVERVIEEAECVDYLINNAGFGTRGAVEEMELHELRNLFDVNVFAPVALTKALLPAMRECGNCRILMVSSVVGRVAMPLSGAYSASKYALEGFADALRVELKPWGIPVILIEPGPIATHFGRTALAEGEARLENEASPYRVFYQHLRRKGYFSRHHVWPPSSVAYAITKALIDESPRDRYPVHWAARLYPFMAQWLPRRVMDDYLARKTGLNG